MRILDRTRMAEKYRGQWVALKADRCTVVGAGHTARAALVSAQKKGVKSPVITRMPMEVRPFIGFA